MRKFGVALIGAAAAALSAVAISPAFASPGVAANGSLAIGLHAGGSVSVDTNPAGCMNAGGCITLGTSSKTEGPLELTNLSGNLGTNSGATGVTPGATVTFLPQPIPVPALMTPTAVNETIKVGTLTFTFTLEETLSMVATGANSAGSFALTFDGNFVSDTSGTFTGLPQTANLSESCTQANLASVIACSNTLQTPAGPTITTPEPASLGLLGVALAGLGLFRTRRRKTA